MSRSLLGESSWLDVWLLARTLASFLVCFDWLVGLSVGWFMIGWLVASFLLVYDWLVSCFVFFIDLLIC
jgi:hypothetical protein